MKMKPQDQKTGWMTSNEINEALASEKEGNPHEVLEENELDTYDEGDTEFDWYKEEQKKYHNKQEKDGSYTLLYEETPIMRNLDKPAEVTLGSSGGTRHYEGVPDEQRDDEITINGNRFLKIEKENESPKFYKIDEGKWLTGATNNCIEVELTNSLKSDEKFKSLRIISRGVAYGGEFDEKLGIAHTWYRDDARNAKYHTHIMYAKQNGEYLTVKESGYNKDK